MAYLDLKLNSKGEATGFTVKTQFQEKVAMNALNAVWSVKSHHWTLPLDADIKLLERLTKVELSEQAQLYLSIRSCKLKDLQHYKTTSNSLSIRTLTHYLDEYQNIGTSYLAYGKRVILADDVGLGKTAQAIVACQEVNANRVLVVTKKSLLYHWLDQIKLWDNQADASIYGTKQYAPKAKYTLVNYESLYGKKSTQLHTMPWQVIIADEATAIKNRKSKRSTAFHTLAHTASYVWLLTATPTPNGPWELWSLLHAIDPNYYSSYWRFVDCYCNTQQVFGGTSLLPGVKNQEKFEEEVSPYILRRDKTLLDLPPVSYETITVKMSPTQERIYKELAEDFISQVADNKYISASTVLAQLTRLRQVLCTPALIGGKDDSAKTDALLELLEDLTPTHKVLVFSAFAGYASNLTQKLLMYNPRIITGEQTPKERGEAARAFSEDSSCKVLIGSIAAMGEGLNLQSATIVIFTDLDWTPARNDIQAVGRAHRRGQDKAVHVITLTTKNTVEEHVQQIVQQKQDTITLVNNLVSILKGGTP